MALNRRIESKFWRPFSTFGSDQMLPTPRQLFCFCNRLHKLFALKRKRVGRVSLKGSLAGPHLFQVRIIPLNLDCLRIMEKKKEAGGGRGCRDSCQVWQQDCK